MGFPYTKDELKIKVFNRTLEKKYNSNPEKYQVLKELLTLSDEEKLAILDASVLPNSTDINSIRYHMFFGYLFADKLRFNELNRFLSFVINTISTLTKSEKEIMRYGYIHGFESKDPLHNYQTFIRRNLKGEEIKKPKQTTLYGFKKIFKFIYKVVKKGELNERFPK